MFSSPYNGAFVPLNGSPAVLKIEPLPQSLPSLSLLSTERILMLSYWIGDNGHLFCRLIFINFNASSNFDNLLNAFFPEIFSSCNSLINVGGRPLGLLRGLQQKLCCGKIRSKSNLIEQTNCITAILL